ncbi:MAG: glycosyltransferase family 2 protein [Bacteroidales bacterium]|nr:glycosyltransferase family 2 protein [Bacteroidales bacterium]
MAKVSIVILNWNGAQFLQRFLPSLLSNTSYPETEVVVADNASTDDSVSIIQQFFPQIKIIQLDRNYGFAGGYNRALAQIDAEYFVILNSDVEVTPGWIEPLIDFLEQHPDAAAVMPKIRSWYNRGCFEHAGAAGGYIDYLGYPFCRGRIFDHLETDIGQYDSVAEVFWVTGACMMIRANVFKTCGGFDDAFFAHMEEIDLCWRIHWKGYKMFCVPSSLVFHVGGGALPAENPFKIYLNFRNNLFLLTKNLESRKLATILCKRFLLDYIAALMFMVQGKFSFFLSVIKAHFHFILSCKKLLRFRNNHSYLSGKFNAHHLIFHKSLVWHFFVKKRKKFSDIFHYSK